MCKFPGEALLKKHQSDERPTTSAKSVSNSFQWRDSPLRVQPETNKSATCQPACNKRRHDQQHVLLRGVGSEAESCLVQHRRAKIVSVIVEILIRVILKSQWKLGDGSLFYVMLRTYRNHSTHAMR